MIDPPSPRPLGKGQQKKSVVDIGKRRRLIGLRWLS
jgi:hypothetical protein